MKKYSYIIFDGECGFCKKIIIFIARNDKNNTFKFISNFSKFGAKILLKNKIKGLEKSTIILVENENEIYTKSLAVRKILLKIKYYKMVGYLMI